MDLVCCDLPKALVNLLMLSAAMTSYGNNFQKLIAPSRKKQKHSYMSSAFQISSNSWDILNLLSFKQGRLVIGQSHQDASDDMFLTPSTQTPCSELRALLLKIQVWNSLHQTRDLKDRHPKTNPGICI